MSIDDIVLLNRQFSYKFQLTWVDLFAAEFFDKILTYGDPNALDAYPLVKKHKEDVYTIPNIKKYIDQRPKDTPF